MTRSVRTLFAAVFTICLIIEITSALSFTKSRSRRSSDGYGDVMDSNMSQQDLLLLQKLLSPPSKRQLCRSGYSYNPVYGGCRASLGGLVDRPYRQYMYKTIWNRRSSFRYGFEQHNISFFWKIMLSFGLFIHIRNFKISFWTKCFYEGAAEDSFERR